MVRPDHVARSDTIPLGPEIAKSRTSGHQNSRICKICSTPCASLGQKSHKR